MNVNTTLKGLLVLFIITLSSFIAGPPDLVVKVIKDDLAKSKKCTIGVLKNGNYKNVDDRYKILSFDMYVLNSRGKAKWHKTLAKPEVDLSKEEVDITKGDLIIIENIDLVNIKSGEYFKVDRITERYLIR